MPIGRWRDLSLLLTGCIGHQRAQQRRHPAISFLVEQRKIVVELPASPAPAFVFGRPSDKRQVTGPAFESGLFVNAEFSEIDRPSSGPAADGGKVACYCVLVGLAAPLDVI